MGRVRKRDVQPVGLEWRDPVWYAVFTTPEGARLRRSTGCAKHEVDKALARRAELEREAHDPHRRTQRTTLRDVLMAFLEGRAALVRAGKRSDATLRYYLQKASILRGYFEPDANDTLGTGLFPIQALDAHAVEGFIETRRNDGVDDRTIHKELGLLRGALRGARRRGEFDGDWAAILTLPDDFDVTYRPRRNFLTREQLPLLLDALPRPRAAVVAFIVATTCELGALQRARREDLPRDPQGNVQVVHIRGTKRATRDRWVPIVTADQRELIAFALAHADGTGGALFSRWSNMRRDLRQAVEKVRTESGVQLPTISPNDLRRTAGSWLRAAGVATDHVAKVMGHSTSRMVELVYGHLTTSELARLMQAAVARIEPPPVMALAERPDAIRVSTKTLPNAPTPKGRATPIGRPEAPPTPRNPVPRGGIEPSTRGFSIRCSTY